jgi:lipid-binding SYLF domain-containing protein
MQPTAVARSTKHSIKHASNRRSWILRGLLSMIAILSVLGLHNTPASAQDYGLEGEARWALNRLTASQPLAGILNQRAYATLVFPDITKAGFLVGGEYGNGVLFRRNGVAGYFNLAAVSYGFQAGAQTYSLVMFFMNEWSWRALSSRDGFQVGVGPSVVVLDEGLAKTVTSTTLTSDVYAFVFGAQGLMAGAGLQGSKITRLNY